MNSRKKRDLDNYVNEIFRKSGEFGPLISASDMVDRMGKCELTERHLPNHVLEIMFGEQLLSPGKVEKMSAANIEGIFSKHNSEVRTLANKWLGKQTIEPSGEKTKTIKVSRNTLDPRVADIIRKRLSQIISTTTLIFSKSICDQILIITEFIQGMMTAAGYMFGTDKGGEQTVSVAISDELTKCYEKVSFNYYNDPRLNYKRTQLDLRPIDFLFFVNTSAGISTADPRHVTLKRLKQDIKTFRKKVGDAKSISETEKMFEDFFVAAFSLPGQDINALSQACATEIKSATEKLVKIKGTAGISEIKKELIADFNSKANGSAKNIYELLRQMSAISGVSARTAIVDLQKMQDELNVIISETQSI